MKKLLIIILLLANVNSIAIAQKISGTWEGIITGGELEEVQEYTFKIYLKVDDKGNAKGTSYVETNKLGIYGCMEFKGKFDGEYINIREEKITCEKSVGDISWCLKNYRLRLFPEGTPRLEGEWSGYVNTGACRPGKVYLKKSAPRA